MEDFEARINRLLKEKNEEERKRQAAIDARNAEIAAAESKKRREAEQEQKRINDHLQTIRQSAAYKQAKAEANSKELHDALEYVHWVVKPRGPGLYEEAEGWIFVKTVYKKGIIRLPFEVNIEEVTHPPSRIDLVVSMPIGPSYLSGGEVEEQYVDHRDTLNFVFKVTEDSGLSRQSNVFISCEHYDSYDGTTSTGRCSHTVSFPDLNSILEYLAQVVARYKFQQR